jgi:CubicO group peptidase (beta-lactamase class C family)
MMKRTGLNLLVLSLMLTLGCNIHLPVKFRGEITSPEPNKELTQRLDQYLISETEKYAFSGSVLIARKGEILLKKGYGQANVEWSQPNTPETVFRIASLTKGFTALAILKFEELGLLSLKDPLSKYIPDFPRGNEVTIQHLLTHTSGIRDYTANSDFPSLMGNPVNLNTLIVRIKAQPYDFTPGNEFHYNNSGYLLLGYILEKISGKSYATVLDEQILKPLGLTQTAYDENQITIRNRASGYVYTKGDLYNAPHLEMSNVYAAGGMRSTVEDLYTYSQALNSPKLLKLENWNRLFTPVRENYALGWVVNTLGNQKAIYHTGSLPGYSSILVKFPEEDITIILLSNLTSVPVKEMAENLKAIIGGQTTKVLPNLKPIALDPKILASYVGDYRLALAYTVTITQREGKLYGHLTGQPEFELIPVSTTQFIIQNLNIEVNFIQSNGKTNRLLLKQNGREIAASKLR